MSYSVNVYIPDPQEGGPGWCHWLMDVYGNAAPVVSAALTGASAVRCSLPDLHDRTCADVAPLVAEALVRAEAHHTMDHRSETAVNLLKELAVLTRVLAGHPEARVMVW